jgi:NAD(P)-dependent dehydrogenase (short-subunit alcohol dehydrogenase family)
MASTALIIGASQGLGASLVRHYAQKLSPSNVFATIRESAPKSDDLFPKGVNVIPNIDVSKKDCGDKVVDGLQGRAVDHVWIVAGLLKGEVSLFHRFRMVMLHESWVLKLINRNSEKLIGTIKLRCTQSAP